MKGSEFFKAGYEDSAAPAFDAIEDLKRWIGLFSWDQFYAEMSQHECPYCLERSFHSLDIPQFPTKAFFELVHGGGSWDNSYGKARAGHLASAYDKGKTLAEKHGYTPEDLLLIEGLMPEEAQMFRDGANSVAEGRH